MADWFNVSFYVIGAFMIFGLFFIAYNIEKTDREFQSLKISLKMCGEMNDKAFNYFNDGNYSLSLKWADASSLCFSLLSENMVDGDEK